jgi:hypothetical protein
MDVEQAQRVQPGDDVAYRKARRRVIAVSHDGLWAPYFDLDEDGMVSYVLVEDVAPAASRSA